jgi:hypothetical protein
MRTFPFFMAAAAAAAIAAYADANAAQTGPLVVESSVLAEQKRAAADASVQAKFAPGAKVVPGGKVAFVPPYRNIGSQARALPGASYHDRPA